MYLFTFFQKQKHCISSYDLSSTNNTTDLESTKFRATIESLWKKIVNQQNINWLTKPQQYILQHQIIDLLKTNLPIKKCMFCIFLHLTCFKQQQIIIPEMQNIKVRFFKNYQKHFSIFIFCFNLSKILGKKMPNGLEN